MNHDIVCAFNRVILKPMSMEESEKMRIVRNKASQWFGFSGEITKEQQKIWYEKYLKNESDYMFSIFHRDTGKWIGAAGLYNIDFNKKTGEYGRIVIDQEITPEKGLGRDSATCICCIGFEKLLLDKITLEVFSDNIPAKTNNLNTGFKIVKTEKISDTRDNLYMELYKEDFKFKSTEL